jgi:predicted metal-dependent phosphoesterase TrpH
VETGSRVRLDLHNHTRHSPDSRVRPADLVHRAQALGLDGIAITDHNSTAGVGSAMEAAKDLTDFVVIPATEVSTVAGHVLAYGVSNPVPRDLSPAETVERIVAAGGVAVAAHPYRFWSGLGEPATRSADFAAYEVHNARTLRAGNEKASRLAEEARVGRTGGSDSHFLDELGRGVTVLDRGVSGADDVLQAIASRESSGQGVHRGAMGTAVYVTKCVSEWILRGMRRI